MKSVNLRFSQLLCTCIFLIFPLVGAAKTDCSADNLNIFQAIKCASKTPKDNNSGAPSQPSISIQDIPADLVELNSTVVDAEKSLVSLKDKEIGFKSIKLGYKLDSKTLTCVDFGDVVFNALKSKLNLSNEVISSVRTRWLGTAIFATEACQFTTTVLERPASVEVHVNKSTREIYQISLTPQDLDGVHSAISMKYGDPEVSVKDTSPREIRDALASQLREKCKVVNQGVNGMAGCDSSTQSRMVDSQFLLGQASASWGADGIKETTKVWRVGDFLIRGYQVVPSKEGSTIKYTYTPLKTAFESSEAQIGKDIKSAIDIQSKKEKKKKLEDF